MVFRRKVKGILVVGAFAPPVSGEAVCNEKIKRYLERHNVIVRVVNATLEYRLEKTGSFSFRKVYRYSGILFSYLRGLSAVSAVYLVPGQSFLGLVRGIPMLLAAKLLGKKVVVHLHGYGFLQAVTAGTFKRCFSKSYQWADCVLVLSRDLKQKLEACGFDSVAVVYNGVPSETKYQNLVTKDYTHCRVLYLSNMIEEKGILELLEAASRCSENIDFSIAGSGDKDIVERIEQVAIKSQHIRYYGHVEGVVKEDLLGSCNVFILPSYYPFEGAPLSMLEAMASGMALVVTRHNAIPEVAGDMAYYVMPRSVDSLVACLEQLAGDMELVSRRAVALQSRSKNYTEDMFLREVSGHLLGD